MAQGGFERGKGHLIDTDGTHERVLCDALQHAGFAYVTTSTRWQPFWRNTSGTRNPPPISTSCPREMMTSRPMATVLSARSTAAALLLVTSAASAPVNSRNRVATWVWREPRSPVSKSY